MKIFLFKSLIKNLVITRSISRVTIVVSFLINSSTSQSQNLVDSTFYNNCDQAQEISYDFLILGSDTLRYFICSKILTHYALDKSPCFTADVIFPKLGKKEGDFYSLQLASSIMVKYNLYEVRMFKSCRARDLASMSIRHPDLIENNKLEREIKESVRTYRRAIEVIK